MTLKVLTIDDDPSMTELLGTLLRNHGMEVLSCKSGPQCIEMARNENPNIIILDLLIPGTSGWEICKTLRSFTTAPIAILSALDDPGTISKALDAGADDFMTKPVHNKVLIAHIKNLARRHMVENGSTIMIRETGLTNIAINCIDSQ
ncbi:MAG: response regulator [Chloroflexi bacterium]|nr:response regulator [Chloroflexota bacterium]